MKYRPKTKLSHFAGFLSRTAAKLFVQRSQKNFHNKKKALSTDITFGLLALRCVVVGGIYFPSLLQEAPSSEPLVKERKLPRNFPRMELSCWGIIARYRPHRLFGFTTTTSSSRISFCGRFGPLFKLSRLRK